MSRAANRPRYWEPICPAPFEVFVIEGKGQEWQKLGATFFEEEAMAVVANFRASGAEVRYRRYLPGESE